MKIAPARPPSPSMRTRATRAARTAGSLTLTLAGAVLLVMLLDPWIPIAHPEYTAAAINESRGYALATALSMAAFLWGAPSLIRRVLP